MFLPEDDIEYLESKGMAYEERTEAVAGGAKRNALLITSFTFGGNLYERVQDALVKRDSCDVLIVIPDGYATTRLDSWYTRQRLVRADGANPVQTSHTENMFGEGWQFWSRHLEPHEWRAGIDGLDTYLQYVRHGFRSA